MIGLLLLLQDPATLISDLGSPDWRVREAATEGLIERGEEIAPLLREALSAAADPEVRARLEYVLDTALRVHIRVHVEIDPVGPGEIDVTFDNPTYRPFEVILGHGLGYARPTFAPAFYLEAEGMEPFPLTDEQYGGRMEVEARGEWTLTIPVPWLAQRLGPGEQRVRVLHYAEPPSARFPILGDSSGSPYATPQGEPMASDWVTVVVP